MDAMVKRESVQMSHDFSADEIAGQVQKIQEVMSKVMKENTHFGTIPGTPKPSLWKPGAEKLALTFKLRPEFETSLLESDPARTIAWKKVNKKTGEVYEEGVTTGYYSFQAKCSLVHFPSNVLVAKAVSGICNNFEVKYKASNPYDIQNTLIKMAEKRALVAAILVATAASDIFTQDLEDMLGGPVANSSAKPQAKPDTRTISEAQRKRLWAIATNRFEEQGVPQGEHETLCKSIVAKHGFESSKDITRAKYEAICEQLANWLP